jgi:D-serine deaminase-like pyridoxal phosphate-dependent protein
MTNNSYLIGLSSELIPTPALVIEAELLEKNIQKMMDYLAQTKTHIRPHTKTYKTPMIAHLQMKAGAIGLCCATVGEAEAMVYAGLDHIFIANEIIGDDKIRRVVNLARYADIIVAVDDEQNLKQLSSAASNYGVSLGVLVDIDVGMGRCGVRSIDDAIELSKRADNAQGIVFRGVFGYEGHAVFIENREERVRVAKAANAYLMEAAQAIEQAGLPVEIVSAAGTGTYDIAAEYPGITEIEAGSYIFMDLTYQKLGLPFEQALTIFSTVLSRPTDETVILDAGMKGISVERTCPVVKDHHELEILHLSEAHANGILSGPDFDPRPGDKLHLIPSHCCTTVNLYDEMYVVRNDIVEAIWPITARGAY